MATTAKLLALSLIAWLLSLCIIGARASPDTSLVKSLCNPVKFVSGGAFDRNRVFVLDDVWVQTPRNGYDYYSESPSSGEVAYGHGACNGKLSFQDCEDCMHSAMFDIAEICNLRYGGQVELKDCRIRYERYPFNG